MQAGLSPAGVNSDTLKFQKTTIYCAEPAAVQQPIRQDHYSIR